MDGLNLKSLSPDILYSQLGTGFSPLLIDARRAAAFDADDWMIAGALAYDIPGAEPFSHEGELCSFDGFLKTYGIADTAFDRLALIVRRADTGRPDLTAQFAGLLAISLGLSANFLDDQTLLDQGMILYDALYTWCRNLQAETHTWGSAA